MKGTRVVVETTCSPPVTLILDSRTEALELLDGAAPRDDLAGVGVRVTTGGSSRGPGEVLSEILVVVQQLATGAAGSGIWAAVHATVTRIARRRRQARPELEQAVQSVKIEFVREDGPVVIHRVTIGPNDPSSEASFERVVRSFLDDPDR